jgi:peptide/nickel transport system permease protein
MSVYAYFVRRLLLVIPVLLGLSIITFTVSRVVPGDPVGLAAGPQSTPEIRERLARDFGLDQPLPLQYVNYMRGLFRGDFGQSLYTRREVADELAARIPATFELTAAAILFASAIGIPMGIISALNQNKIPDHLARILSLFFVSFPAFWLAMIFQSAFGVTWDLSPVSGRFPRLDVPPDRITGLFTLDSLLSLDFASLGSALHHLWLPALVLSFGALASITRITRASMLEALNNDSVKTERSIGIPWRVVVIKYVLRNAFIATFTVISLQFGWLMAGAVLVEAIFDWPGLGLFIVESSLGLDFQPIMGITLVYGIIFSIVNIVTDIAYGVIDPRIRYG